MRRLPLAVALLLLPALAFAIPVTVAWDPNPPEQLVTHYRVYDGDALVCDTPETRCPLDLLPGTHTLTATALNRYGLESDRSPPLVLALEPPGVVSGLRIEIVQTQTQRIQVGP